MTKIKIPNLRCLRHLLVLLKLRWVGVHLTCLDRHKNILAVGCKILSTQTLPPSWYESFCLAIVGSQTWISKDNSNVVEGLGDCWRRILYVLKSLFNAIRETSHMPEEKNYSKTQNPDNPARVPPWQAFRSVCRYQVGNSEELRWLISRDFAVGMDTMDTVPHVIGSTRDNPLVRWHVLSCVDRYEWHVDILRYLTIYYDILRYVTCDSGFLVWNVIVLSDSDVKWCC